MGFPAQYSAFIIAILRFFLPLITTPSSRPRTRNCGLSQYQPHRHCFHPPMVARHAFQKGHSSTVSPPRIRLRFDFRHCKRWYSPVALAVFEGASGAAFPSDRGQMPLQRRAARDNQKKHAVWARSSRTQCRAACYRWSQASGYLSAHLTA